MLVTTVNQYLGGPPPHYAFIVITACAALGQNRDLQTRGGRPEGLRLSDREVGSGQGRGHRSGRLRSLARSQAAVLKE